MEAPIYKEQGTLLFKIANNIIIELDLVQYHLGIISCTTSDARLMMMEPSSQAKVIGPEKFEKYYTKFLHFLNTANNTGGNDAQFTGSTPALAGEPKGYEEFSPDGEFVSAHPSIVTGLNSIEVQNAEVILLSPDAGLLNAIDKIKEIRDANPEA